MGKINFIEMSIQFRNCTPHPIKLNSGEVFAPELETPIRVSQEFSDFDANGICTVKAGEVTGLPEPQKGVCLIVSAMVLEAGKQLGRTDLVAPATGHSLTVRSEKGFIVSVPGFIR